MLLISNTVCFVCGLSEILKDFRKTCKQNNFTSDSYTRNASCFVQMLILGSFVVSFQWSCFKWQFYFIFIFLMEFTEYVFQVSIWKKKLFPLQHILICQPQCLMYFPQITDIWRLFCLFKFCVLSKPNKHHFLLVQKLNPETTTI